MPQRGRQLPQHEHKSSWSSARAGSTVTCSALWRQQWGRDGRADWGRPRTPSVDESRQGGGQGRISTEVPTSCPEARRT